MDEVMGNFNNAGAQTVPVSNARAASLNDGDDDAEHSKNYEVYDVRVNRAMKASSYVRANNISNPVLRPIAFITEFITLSSYNSNAWRRLCFCHCM